MTWWATHGSLQLDRDGTVRDVSRHWARLGHIAEAMPAGLTRRQEQSWEWLADEWASYANEDLDAEDQRQYRLGLMK